MEATVNVKCALPFFDTLGTLRVAHGTSILWGFVLPTYLERWRFKLDTARGQIKIQL